jgi:leucyl aminopeptidase (aminopeptidase T)
MLRRHIADTIDRDRSMNQTTRRVLILAACLLAAPLHGEAQQSGNAIESDWKRIANAILHRSLELAPGERVIIQYLPDAEPGLVRALRNEITTSGGVISAELTWPTQEMAHYFDSLSPEQRSGLAQIQNAVYREIFARSDVYLWLDESPVDDLVSRQFEHLIRESNVRAIHCHFQGAPSPKDNPELWQAYVRAIEMEPSQLQTIEDSSIKRLRGKTLRLVSPEGTDLTFKVLPDAWFHENTGDASKTKPRNPKSTRDREEEIPSGDVRTTGVVGVSGRLVGDVLGNPADSATLTFKDGRLIKIEPRGKQAAEFAKWFATATGDRDRVGELVIGNNPYLTPVAVVNPAADFGYRAGTVRLDVGENWESGGELRTSDHQQWAIIVSDGTLTTGHELLIKAGKPVP